MRQGGNLVQGTLRGAPCAGSPRALWGLEVSQSKKPGKTPIILHFVNITNQMHGFVINLPSSNLKMCTTLNPLAPGPRKWRLKHATLKIDCVYFKNVAPIMGSVAPAIEKVDTGKKPGPVVKNQVPASNAAAPNRKLLRTAICFCDKKGCSPNEKDRPNDKESPPRKESGSGTQESCKSAKKGVDMTKQILFPY